MKGVIVGAMKELVEKNFGKKKWDEIMTNAGLDAKTIFLPMLNVEDNTFFAIFNSLCKTLNLTANQAADAFGDFWVNTYSNNMYSCYYQRAKNAREFLLNMDAVHVSTTETMPGANPPRFEYQWKDKSTLVMTYKSERSLIDVLVSLIKGVGKFYREKLIVTKLDDNRVEIVF